MSWFKRKENLWVRDRLIFMERMVMISNEIAARIKAEQYRSSLSGDTTQLRQLRADMQSVSDMVQFIGKTETQEEFLNSCRSELQYLENTYMN